MADNTQPQNTPNDRTNKPKRQYKKRTTLKIDVNPQGTSEELLASGSTTPMSEESSTPVTPSRRKKVKTKFPVARIKRIIQADEEIGKVSSVTPVLISRCLELFIEDLVMMTAKLTKEKQAKTMSLAHLKECIEKNDCFDFLREKVENIQITNTKKRSKKDDEDEEPKPKKKRASKKKQKQEEEEEE